MTNERRIQQLRDGREREWQEEVMEEEAFEQRVEELVEEQYQNGGEMHSKSLLTLLSFLEYISEKSNAPLLEKVQKGWEEDCGKHSELYNSLQSWIYADILATARTVAKREILDGSRNWDRDWE